MIFDLQEPVLKTASLNDFRHWYLINSCLNKSQLLSFVVQVTDLILLKEQFQILLKNFFIQKVTAMHTYLNRSSYSYEMVRVLIYFKSWVNNNKSRWVVFVLDMTRTSEGKSEVVNRKPTENILSLKRFLCPLNEF